MNFFIPMEGRFKIEDFITLPELLLRWPSDPHFKIVNSLYNRELHAHFIEEIFVSKDGTLELRLSDITEKFTLHVSFFMLNSWKIIFKKEDVIALELLNTDFTKLKIIHKTSYQDPCSRSNIEQIAALTIYLVCRFNYPEYKCEINDFLLRRATARTSETSECPPGEVESWRIDSANLWKLYNEIIPQNHIGNRYDIPKIITLVDQLLANDGVEYIEVVKSIYLAYSKLTSAQLGEIFPFNREKEVRHSGKQSRGKFIKNQLFLKYPELKPHK